jgi:hypothetical protein
VKSKDRLYESWNGSTGMEKKECSGIACWKGNHCIEAWQKRYNEKVMVKFNYNVDKYIQTH